MTIEQIERAAKETLVNEPVEIQATKVGTFQRGFIAGAQWMADRLCHLPLDKVLQELAEYINQKEEEK